MESMSLSEEKLIHLKGNELFIWRSQRLDYDPSEPLIFTVWVLSAIPDMPNGIYSDYKLEFVQNSDFLLEYDRNIT